MGVYVCSQAGQTCDEPDGHRRKRRDADFKFVDGPQVVAVAAHPAILRSIRSTYSGFSSMPTQFLRSSLAATSVVPDPA